MEVLFDLIARLSEHDVLRGQSNLAALLNVTFFDDTHLLFEDFVEGDHVLWADQRLQERVHVVEIDWVTDLSIVDLEEGTLVKFADTLDGILKGFLEL